MSRRHLTPALAARAVDLVRGGLTCRHAAQRLTAEGAGKVTHQWVEQRCRAAGIHRSDRGLDLRPPIVEAYLAGKDCRTIARDLSAQIGHPIGEHWVRRAVRAAGLTNTNRRDHLIPRARELYATGMRLDDVRATLRVESGQVIGTPWLQRVLRAEIRERSFPHLTAAAGRRAAELMRKGHSAERVADQLTAEIGRPVATKWVRARAQDAGVKRSTRLDHLRPRVAELLRAGLTHTEIAARLVADGYKVSRYWVTRQARLLELQGGARREHLVPRVVELYRAGASLSRVRQELATETGITVSVGWLYDRLRERGALRTQKQGTRLHIRQHGHHSQRDRGGRRRAQALAILEGAAAGLSWQAIAEKVGCSRSVVRNVLRESGLLRRTWKVGAKAKREAERAS